MFQESSVQDLTMNPFEKVNKQWMLITAGDEKGFNTMTASWGGLGVIWQKPGGHGFIFGRSVIPRNL